MRKIIFMMVLFLIPSVTLANTIENIDMDIYVDTTGTAHVREVWSATLTEGTEGYKPYYNLGTSSISNFKVSLNDKEYTYSDNYDINDSFNAKKYKNGFHYIDNGVELCFGISEYGENTYTLSYDITNFVVATSDSYQMIYWTLFPSDYNPSPDRVHIKIYSDFKYSDTLDVWGYGKYGAPTYVSDGYIEMDSEDTVSNSEYLTILVKFPEDTFKINTTLDNTFDYYLDMAEEGSTKYQSSSDGDVFSTIFSIICMLFPISIFILIAVLAAKNGYGYIDNKKIDKKTVNMFREIPCNKDIYYANALIKLNLNIFSGYKETNIFGSIILKWVKEGKVKFREEEKGVFKKETSMLDLTLSPTFDENIETELFNMMYEASNNGILSTKDLEKYCTKHYSKFLSLFNRMYAKEEAKLKQEQHIYKRKNKEECKRKNVLDDMIYSDTIKLYGLKKYLEEFSRINTKEVLEVHIWDEYLMFAYLFGIADKVAKQLKNLYPEYINNNNDIDFNTLMYINYLSTRSVSAASSARAKAESYSSGGGGFSSGGGGGGSFGGGGGGGGFR